MLLLSLLFACNETPETPAEECVDVERTPSTDDATLDVVEGNQDFAFDVYEQLREGDSNVFLSPYSISTALGMLHLGAEGETETEISSVLNVFEPQLDWHSALAAAEERLVVAASEVAELKLLLGK